MKKFYHKKLIRDRIPQIIEDNNGKYKVRKLDEKEYQSELRRKLLEEAEEAKEADTDELLKELSDVLQVIKSIAEVNDIEFNKVEAKQKERRQSRGAFKNKLFLVWSNQKGGD